MSIRMPADDAAGGADRTAIIDIGSNSVRLVIYGGPPRCPAVLFNEKASAGLGGALEATGAMDEAAMAHALAMLARFRLVLERIPVSRTIVVATAAVRDASNGAAFVERIEAMGFAVQVLRGDEEARYAALGVASAIPEADGLVGDLGGGSLEIARLERGAVTQCLSTPYGVLRVARAQMRAGMPRGLAQTVEDTGWLRASRGLPFHLVGGSWRAIAHVDLHLSNAPLRVLHAHRIMPDRVEELARAVRMMDRDALRSVPDLSTGRIDSLKEAFAVLMAVQRSLEPSRFVVSAHGLREGLLFAGLDGDARALDPLLEATAAFGRRHSRLGQDGAALHRWLVPVFAPVDPDRDRLLRAACHLADTAWQASPDFRAERGVEIALHGAWVGIDAGGRALIAQALFTALGGGPSPFPGSEGLLDEEALRCAIGWGLGIRLAQKLSGGAPGILADIALVREPRRLVLVPVPGCEALASGTVQRRLQRLAQHVGLTSAPRRAA